MPIQWYLNILVNTVVESYFPNTLCMMHIYDNKIDPVKLLVPHYLTKDIDTFRLDPYKACRHFLLQCEATEQAFNKIENVIKYDSDGMYNNRKYLIIINKEEAFEEFFNSTLLTFVRDILIIYTLEENVHSEPTINLIPEDNEVVFTLYTHKYVGVQGNNNPVHLDTWHSHNQSFQFGNNLYPDKIINQKGRELRVACKHYAPYAVCNSTDRKQALGIEHNIILKYADMYNYTLKMYPNNGISKVFANWTGFGCRTGLIRDIDYYDIVYGGRRRTLHTDGVLSVSYTYEVSVPMPTIYYGWLWVFRMFHSSVWFLLFITFATTYLVIQMRRFLLNKQLSNGSEIQAIEIFGLFISQSSASTDELRNSFVLKFLSLVILFSSILFGAAYNSRLSSIMVMPMYSNDIKTLDEYAKSQYNLLFFDEYYHPLAEDTREVYKKIYEKIYLVPLLNGTYDIKLLEKLLSSGNHAVARFRRFKGGYNEEYEFLQFMYGKYKPITPELFTNAYYLLLRKNSMHTIQLQKLVMSANTLRIMAYWEEEALRDIGNTTFQMKLEDVKVNIAKQHLNMKNMKGCFAFWLTCMFISTIVFLIELNIDRKHRKAVRGFITVNALPE